MSLILELFVPGAPKTKGSMEHIGNGQMRESVKGSSTWRRLVAQRVTQELMKRPGPRTTPVSGPVRVDLQFSLRVEDVTVKGSGDLDKLTRNVLDALTDARLYGDDAQVVSIWAQKYEERMYNQTAPFQRGVLLMVSVVE